jgi:hypothetical protein
VGREDAIVVGKQVNLSYDSVRGPHGGNGVMRVATLRDDVCCGRFDYTPSEHEKAVAGAGGQTEAVRIGADWSRTATCEWNRVGVSSDPVRRYLALIPNNSAAYNPRLVASGGDPGRSSPRC